MAPQIILGPNNKYTVLDNYELVLEDVTQIEVENYYVEEFRRRFWQMAPVSKVSELEYLVLSGKVKCCDCGEPVQIYNPNWKQENQRCEKCKQ